MARTGLDPRPHLPVYFAYNFFRIAAILQGIAGRVRDGTATSAFAAAKAEWCGRSRRRRWALPVQAGRMKTFALALGAGGARGLAHIAVFEALDEMGVQAGRDRRRLDRRADRRRLRGRHERQGHPPPRHRARPQPRRDAAAPDEGARRHVRATCSSGGFSQATQLDAEKFCAQFLPDGVPANFARWQFR